MRWVRTTRERNGIRERRCGNARHEGVRWLPLTEEHFYLVGRCYWCRPCQRRYMLARWRALHPPRPSRAELRMREQEAKAASATLEHLTSGWGR